MSYLGRLIRYEGIFYVVTAEEEDFIWVEFACRGTFETVQIHPRWIWKTWLETYTFRIA